MWYIGIFILVMMLGAVTLAYQMFKMIYLDAKSRDLKHPVFWGIFSMGGNNGSGGLLLYLLGRNKYISNMSEADRRVMEKRKKYALVSLCFIAVGALGTMATALLNGVF